MSWTIDQSLVLLIPHLEQWVLEHALPIVGESPREVDWYRPNNCPGPVFQLGSLVYQGLLCGVAVSIKGLYEGEDSRR